MKKFFRLLLMIFAISLVGGPFCWCGSIKLPPEIRNILDTQYPGWKFQEVRQSILKFVQEKDPSANASLCAGDFDGDGNLEYAVQIVENEHRHVLVFLKKDGEFEEHVLQDGDPSTDFFIMTAKQGTQGYDSVQARFYDYPHDSVVVYWFQKASMAYVYQDDEQIFLEIPCTDL